MKNPKYIMFVDDEINIFNALKREVSDWAEEQKLEVMTASSPQKPWDSDYLLTEIKKAWDNGELKRQNNEYLKKMKEELCSMDDGLPSAPDEPCTGVGRRQGVFR